MSKRIQGGCLCGELRYSIADNLLYAGYCHCSECRKASGSAFLAFGGLLPTDLSIEQGDELLGKFEKSEESTGYFCKGCGSSVFAEKPKLGFMSVLLGSLDSTPSLRPQFHIHTASKAPWYQIADKLPQYAHDPE